jgi:hypothetical protein
MGVLVEDFPGVHARTDRTMNRFDRNDGFLMVWRKQATARTNADCGLRTGVVEKQISPLRGPR